MNQAEIAVVVGVVATAVTFVQILPQIARLLRIGRTEGVSPVWAAIGTTVNIGWIAYVVAEELWVTIPAVLAGAGSYGVTGCRLRGHRSLASSARAAAPMGHPPPHPPRPEANNERAITPHSGH